MERRKKRKRKRKKLHTLYKYENQENDFVGIEFLGNKFGGVICAHRVAVEEIVSKRRNKINKPRQQKEIGKW